MKASLELVVRAVMVVVVVAVLEGREVEGVEGLPQKMQLCLDYEWSCI